MSKQKNKIAGLQKRKAISGYLFISPFIIGFLVFMVKPLLDSFYMSFCDVSLAAGSITKTFHGLVNYVFGEGDKSLAKELMDGENDADKVYTRLWTVKESIMKHSGKGIAMEPKSISLRLEDSKIKASSAVYDCEALNLLPYEIENYQITVCSEYEEFTLLKPF